MKCFNNFGQFAENTRNEEDEKSNFSVVAETKKFLANNSCRYQIMHWSRHTVTKCLSDEKTQLAIKNKMFKCVDC